MQPSPAEVARTLAAGHLPAVAHLACRPGPFPVRHVTDDHGRVLLLSPAGGALAGALRPRGRAGDTAVVLDISDGPGEPRVVRLDRYGFLVRLGDRLARLSFPRPVTD